MHSIALKKMDQPKVLFFVAVDWFFCSHFLDRAVAAKRNGYEVVVLTHTDRHKETIENVGLRVIHLTIDRRSLNPFSSLRTLWQLIDVFRRERPHVLHQVALKPILLGGIAARLSGVRHVVNAVVGGGYVFTSTALLVRLIRPIVRMGLHFLLNPPGSRVVFENRDDLQTFVRNGQVRAQDAVLIRGAGVDVQLYPPRVNYVSTLPKVIVPARLLWDKGIGEFVQAARMLREQGIQARFVLVGDVDPGNRACIAQETLDSWKTEGAVELWGFQQDMPKVLAEADIVCLPSYREGLPKALLEGMAAGLPCVTTDVPGCREAVSDGDNGLLVPARNPEALAEALSKLINDSALRHRMGDKGRNRALSEFSSMIICQQTLRVYEDMITS